MASPFTDRANFDFNPRELPLFLRDVPTRAERGKPFTVRVEKIQPDRHPDGYYLGGTGQFVPAEGVVVQIGNAVSAKTGADGRTRSPSRSRAS
jgi:hypothetical protein